MKRILLLLCLSVSLHVSAQSTWRGLIVEPENRCTPYDKKSQYPYPQSVEDVIVANMDGRIYGPYEGRYFNSDRETDIEHIVAASEGHDSGLCSSPRSKKVQFATDPLNLTLASPKVNRCSKGGKCGFDAAQWMPEKNKCWFANRIVQIKIKYDLSVDQAEARSLESVLSNCASFEMQFFTEDEKDHAIPLQGNVIPRTEPIIAAPTNAPTNTPTSTEEDALEMYDTNRNGRITCSEARSHGIAPVTEGHPAYPFMRDADGDGVVCR
jgi:hypothetical protein